jgi:hypothetical protein
VLYLTLNYNVEGYILDILMSLLSALLTVVFRVTSLMKNANDRLESLIKMPTLI